MDETPDSPRTLGGNVEPGDRGFVAKDRAQATTPSERFELHDPRADLTYRTRTFVDMVTRANQIGASRFVAIDPEGVRSTVSKVAGVWRRDVREARRAAEPKAETDRVASPKPPRVQPDKAVAAERTVRVLKIEAALHERYVIKRAPIRIGDVIIGQTEYRHRGDTTRVAFTESAFRLSTDNNSPSVARSMVDVAEARGWQELRISGNEDFRRMVWLEASVRDVKTVGYHAVQADLDLLAKEKSTRQINRVEPAAAPGITSSTTPPVKQSERGSGGRKAVLAALEALLVARNVPERQRNAVMAAAAENLAARTRQGEVHRIKVYDKSAPSQVPLITPSREVRREQERGTRSR